MIIIFKNIDNQGKVSITTQDHYLFEDNIKRSNKVNSKM